MLFRHSFAAACLSLAFAAQAATPTHLYLLGDATDQMGGPSLVSLGGTFGATASGQTGYRFAVNQGLSLSSALNAAVYTIDFSFAFDTVSGYRRLLDFQNGASDNGLYNLTGALSFFPISISPQPDFVVGQLARVTVTRDAAGQFTGYVNGVSRLSFADVAGEAKFSAPSQIAYFFRDDNAVRGEASAGFADYIRVYDVALTASEVEALTAPVPEPGSWALMALGLLAVAGAARRR